MEATESKSVAPSRSVGWSVYLVAASVELWRYFRQGDERERAHGESTGWLAFIRIAFLPSLFSIFRAKSFQGSFSHHSSSKRRRPAWNARAHSFILGMGLAVTSGELTDQPAKKPLPRNSFFASVVTDEGRGNQRQYRAERKPQCCGNSQKRNREVLELPCYCILPSPFSRRKSNR